jgi:ParB-like chromosome segregation protein Spo0J
MNIANHTKENLAEVSTLKENPRNPNRHTEKQVSMLANILKFQGWRTCIVVSNQSGFIVRGHARLAAAKKLGLEKVPVSFQDYDDDAQEWSDLIADNRIAELAELDRVALKDLIEELDTGEVDLDNTGYNQQDLELLMSQIYQEGENDADEEWEDMPEFKQENLLAKHRLMICFTSDKDRDDFAKKIGQKLNDTTKSIWFPEQKKDKVKNLRVSAEK